MLDVWLSATAVLDEAGAVEAIAFTERDVTERHRAARELQAINDTLEQRIVERTAEAESRTRRLRDLTSALASAEQRARQRLTRILHDGLQQILVGAKYKLRARRAERERAAGDRARRRAHRRGHPDGPHADGRAQPADPAAGVPRCRAGVAGQLDAGRPMGSPSISRSSIASSGRRSR